MKRFIAILLIALLAAFAWADTHAAASAELADVQAAVNASADGDTVTVPVDTATWSDDLDLNKAIILQGAGIGQTVITRAGDAITCTANARITGFTFTGNGMCLLMIDTTASRIDHCRLVNTSGGISNLVNWYSNQTPTSVHPKGLLDHCEIVDGRLLTRGTAWLRQDGGYKAMQDALWYEDFAYGSADYIFIEDSEFWATGFNSSTCDANYGGRFVFRYNTVHCAYFEFHSVQGNNRAGRRWEIYENSFVMDNPTAFPSGVWVPMFIRGGTGVCWNNYINGYNNGIALNNVRDTENVDTSGLSDGSSDWDQNTPGQGGWAARDQIGRGRDTVQWVDHAAYTQVSEPAYFWGNTGNSSTPFVHNPHTPAHIVEDRDYYNGTAKPGYTPYTYPHPLQGGGEPEPPATGGFLIGG